MGKSKKAFLNRDEVLKKLLKRHHERKPSPLETLQEIFEEATDKDRFVGDTMFWKYFEDIDIQRIYHTNSVEYRNLFVMFWETLFYLLVLFVFTLYCYQIQSRTVFDARDEQVNYWSGCTATGECRIKEVDDISSFWHWMQEELVPRAFTDYTSTPPDIAHISTPYPNNEFPLSWSPRFVGPQMSNALLGTIRVRQLRVRPNVGCEVSKLVSHVFPDCFGPFAVGWKSNVKYMPRFGPTYLEQAFTWQDEEETRQVPMLGTMGTYGGDGYTWDLPVNKSDAVTMISDLYRWGWVDRATRAIIIELTTLNTNCNVITNSRILFEMGPTGSVVGKAVSNTGRILFFNPTARPVAQIILAILFLVYTVLFFWLMYKTCHNFLGEHPMRFVCKTLRSKAGCSGVVSVFVHTLYHYLRYGWNIVDLVILVFFYTHMGYRFDTYAAIGREPNMDKDVIGHPEYFMPFSRVMQSLTAGNNVLSLLAMFCWCKLFKYLCMSNYFRLLVRILERCAAKLVVFSALLLVVFFGFAVAFFVGFGGTERAFSTLSGSFLVLFFLLIDGYTVDERWFEPGKEMLMPVVFFCYLATIYFVLLNIFVAVVLDVYATTHQPTSRQMKKKNPMLVFIYTYWHWNKGVSLVRTDTEEHFRKEDLTIKLDLLPGIVRRKWIEKKRKMQRVASESFAGMELFPGDEDMMQPDRKTISDWMLPSTRVDVVQKMLNPTPHRPVRLYEIPGTMLNQDISRAQLQRLMDEDATMPLLLGKTTAVEVIRQFKQRAADAAAAAEEDEVKALQGTVYQKIDALEKVKLDGDVPDVPEIKEITKEMSDAITDVRNQFRIQLTGIIEATAVLFEHLVELTQGIDAVRQNHKDVLDMTGGDNAMSDGGATSY